MDRGAVAHVAGHGAEADDAVDRDRHHEHEDRHRADQQDVVDGVDLVRRARRGVGEPVDQQRDRDADHRGDDAERDHPRDRVLLALDPRIVLGRALPGCPAAGSLSLIGARVLLDPSGRAGASGGERRARRRRAAMLPSARPTAGAVVAAERLGELRGLAVADRPGDRADRQRARRAAARRRAPCARAAAPCGSSCRARRTRAGAGAARWRSSARPCPATGSRPRSRARSRPGPPRTGSRRLCWVDGALWSIRLQTRDWMCFASRFGSAD